MIINRFLIKNNMKHHNKNSNFSLEKIRVHQLTTKEKEATGQKSIQRIYAISGSPKVGIFVRVFEIIIMVSSSI